MNFPFNTLRDKVPTLKASSLSNWSLEKTCMAGGFSIVLILIGAVSLVSYKNATQLEESTNQVKQTNTVLKTLADISATLTKAELHRWEYIFFREEAALGEFNAAIERLEPQIKELQWPLGDTSDQLRRLNKLETLVIQQINLLQQSIQQFDQNQSVLTRSDSLIIQSKLNRESIQFLIAELQAEEEKILQAQIDAAQESHQIRIIIEISGTLLTFAVLFWIYFLLYRQLVERQRAESQQQALVQAKELGELKLQFFSMISHEFRTPLSLVLGSAQLLEENIRSLVPQKRLKNLYRIQTSARLMTQLLNDILTLARAEAGRLECNRTLVEMQSFCLNLIEDVQLSHESKHSIIFTKQGSCTHANVDEKLLYSIISNLLSNAVKYSPQDKNIYFRLNCKSQFVAFEIKDEGIGIPEGEQVNLYEPFSRGRNARGIIGTGLGLAVVKQCLDLHQGTVAVESKVGVGTTFSVAIPTSPS